MSHDMSQEATSSETIGGKTIGELRESRLKAMEERDAVMAEFLCQSPDTLKNYFRGLPKVFKWGWLSAFLGKSSKGKAIKAKCYDCAGYSKTEVANCQVKTCPLWNYRPKIAQ